MIICVCNSISDKAINTAVTSGANTPSLVYKSCGANHNAAVAQNILSKKSTKFKLLKNKIIQ